MNQSKNELVGAEPRRIFVVEDHPITRLGLVELINDEPDMRVCGEADGSADTVKLIHSLKPDLVLLDITLPGKSGLVLIKEIQAWLPNALILAISMHDEDLYAERVLRAGGHGYVMKSAGREMILHAMRQVMQGETFVSEHVSKCIVDTFAGRRPESVTASLGRLSDREFEVFQLIGQGLPTAEIGQRLFVSPKTIDSHRLHIMDKLNLHSLPELMRYAVRWAATEEMI
ncbi:MAG TPA: response regulator transcription factor [Verrucomicrobiae bacterium]|nr:response regulator transcription factor [Verrucomicrobiae bacterium]